MKQITLLFMMVMFCFSAMTAATEATALTSNNTTTIDANLPVWKMKLVEKFENKMAKVSKLTKKMGIKAQPQPEDLLARDAKWWLKMWLLFWAGGLIFSVLGAFTLYGLYYLGYLLWTLGSICFLVWILKKLEVL
jgi:hypothetical protein